ncbi:hypothetical protein [Clostridium sp. C2-6-12]|nr:hypothetical protein [Clostridium sp. C2-6-12]
MQIIVLINEFENANELFKFIEYEDIGHTVTNEMLEETYRWIKINL